MNLILRYRYADSNDVVAEYLSAAEFEQVMGLMLRLFGKHVTFLSVSRG